MIQHEGQPAFDFEKRRAIFDRYTIVNDRRMKQNIQKLEEHLKTKRRQGKTVRETELKCFRIMVSRAGLEPATTALKVRCSTN